ncbi:caspase family protein [Streptomyces sp. NPDC085946]|uniref:caspase family protein n=1 Tax=Streptomyces sp. NPDC085946 TaxID=3365744 RepID=UPI0037CD8021
MDRFDPRGLVNRALLVGVSEYDLTEPPHGVPGDLPAVKHNVTRLREALSHGGVFDEHEIRRLRSPSQDEFGHALRTVAAEAEGLLLLYFAGHGAIPSAGDELFLQMRNASVIAGGHAVFPGAEMFTTVLTVLATSPARRIVVVLDCCFAGNAAWIRETFHDRRRVLLLMSVQANHRIDAGDPRTPTPFTAELARLLEGEGELGFRDLADRLRERMAAAGHRTVRGEPWEPQSRTEPDEDVLLAAPEPRTPPALRPPGPQPAPGPGDTRPRPPEREPWGRRARAVLLGLLRAPAARPGPSRLLGLLRPGRRALTRLVLPLVAAALALGSYGLFALTGGPVSCVPPLELRVLTDPDLEPTVRSAADAYLTSAANTTGDGCRRTGITVYSAGSSDVVTALRKQTAAWQEPHDDTNPQRDIGPQPDIWIPGSRADVARVADGQDTDAAAVLRADDEPLAYSPIVLAVPHNLAAEPLPDRMDRTLGAMVAALLERDADAEVRRPDPEFTDAALLATIGLYGPGMRDAARAERLVAPAGPPAPTAADLMCTLPDDDAVDNRTAALVPEFLMRTGVGCDGATRSPRIAQYPEDVPGLEPLFVRVRWQGADRDRDARDGAVEDFHDWLTGQGGREVFAGDGFRAATGHSRALLDPERVAAGVLRAPAPLDESAGRDEMAAALDGYRGARGPGRVLFLLDSSGSMAGRWQGPSGGPGLLRQSLGGLGGQDEYAVWAVADTAGERPYTTLLPFGGHRRDAAGRALDERARTRDAEADPHAALLAAFGEMERRGADRRPQLIVYVTDDEDADRLAGDRLGEVLAAAGTARVPVAMVSLESGGCDPGRPDRRISDESGGRCLDAGDDLGAALRDEVARTGTGED